MEVTLLAIGSRRGGSVRLLVDARDELTTGITQFVGGRKAQ